MDGENSIIIVDGNLVDKRRSRRWKRFMPKGVVGVALKSRKCLGKSEIDHT